MNQTAKTRHRGDWTDLLQALGERARLSACDRAATPFLKCHIEWPKEGLLRARRVVRRSNARITYKYPSMQVARMVQCESNLELKGFQLLDACPLVTLEGEQPAAITLLAADGQELQTHYPDALVQIAERRVFVEFKYAGEAREPLVRKRTADLQRALAMQGYGYCVLTEEVIEQQPRLSTMKVLLVRGRRRVDEVDAEWIRRWFRESGGRTRRWGEITRHPQAKVLIPQVSRLILEGRISMPLNQVVNDQTKLSVC